MSALWKKLEVASVAAASAVAVLAAAIGQAQDRLPAPEGPEGQQQAGGTAVAKADMQVMTRGPVHEAFANPLANELDEGLVVSEQPPEPIDELPPEYMPEGENVEWIPGYWAWDDDDSEFIWVSGLWRNVPPDQRWVPGYWTQVDRGYRWISGFWAAADTDNLDYLPYPPASQERGPNVAAPGEEYFWVPGSWAYQSNDYQWRPGYWAPAHDHWCWIPARYVWTPRGALYSRGYWDYRLPNRGTLFAPVRFGDRGFFRGGRRFTPGHVINPSGLLVSLFVRPQYRHYYFGNYYGDQYRNRGFRPWFDPSFGGDYYYDPMLAFYESYYDRRGIDFSGRINQWFNFYEQNPDRRPAVTWDNLSRGGAATGAGIVLANSLDELVNGRRGQDGDGLAERWNFRRLSQDQQVSFTETANRLRDFIQDRSQVEAEGSAEAGARVGDRGDAQADAEAQAEARAEGRTGLRLPAIENRARQILGNQQPGDDRRDQQPGDRPTDRPQDRPQDRPAEQPRDQRPDGDRPQRDRSPEIDRPQQRPEPPQPPSNRPGDENARQPDGRPGEANQAPGLNDRVRDALENRQRNLDEARERANEARQRANELQQRGNEARERANEAQRQIERNIFQPRRGNFPQADPNRRQQRSIDPREAIPNFEGRGNPAQRFEGRGNPGQRFQGRGNPGQQPGGQGIPQGRNPQPQGPQGAPGGNLPGAGNPGGPGGGGNPGQAAPPAQSGGAPGGSEGAPQSQDD